MYMAARNKDNQNSKFKFGKSEGASPTGVIVVLFILLLFAIGATMLIRQNTVQARVETHAEELAEQEALAAAENEQAHALANKVGSDVFIEEMARDELGMVKSGEVIYDTESDDT